jgi:hypothetical protein
MFEDVIEVHPWDDRRVPAFATCSFFLDGSRRIISFPAHLQPVSEKCGDVVQLRRRVFLDAVVVPPLLNESSPTRFLGVQQAERLRLASLSPRVSLAGVGRPRVVLVVKL